MIHDLNQHKPYHIVTIEDPIEFVHTPIKSRVTQREVGSDTQSFNEGLRQVVRQSPDVIMIGEMRDKKRYTGGISSRFDWTFGVVTCIQSMLLKRCNES